ncbi:MAG: NAD-dependent epimerase/dehydratase family protein [bacterium]
MNANKVLITGATGYIGSRLSKALLGEGCKVRCFVRDGEKAKPLREMGAEIVEGDIADEHSLQGIADGIDVIYHLAGAMTGDEAFIRRVNVGGTENLLRACEGKKLSAFVYSSSCTVYGDNPGRAVDESTPSSPQTAYTRSKVAVERMLLERFEEEGLPSIILRFGGVYGKDSSIVDMGMVREGRMKIVGRGENYMQLIYIDDLVDILKVVPIRARAGEIYIIADDLSVKVSEFYKCLAGEMGAPPPKHIAVPIAKMAIRFIGLLSKLTGFAPIMTEDTLKTMLSSLRCSNRKMKEALGVNLKFPTYRDGIADMLRSINHE